MAFVYCPTSEGGVPAPGCLNGEVEEIEKELSLVDREFYLRGLPIDELVSIYLSLEDPEEVKFVLARRILYNEEANR